MKDRKEYKKRSGSILYFNSISLPEEGQAVLCQVAILWPFRPGLAEICNGKLVISLGFYYLSRDYCEASFNITLEQWVESIREHLAEKEILWKPLDSQHVHYADGYFGRPHIASEFTQYVSFDPAKQKEILSLLGR